MEKERIKDYIDARELFIQRVKKQLLGPGSEYDIPDREHELITENPAVRYSVGVLYPQEKNYPAEGAPEEPGETDEAMGDYGGDSDDQVDASGGAAEDDAVDDRADDDSQGEGVAENDVDEDVNLAQQNRQSSCGVTFFVVGDSDKVVCSVEFATYRRSKLTDCRLHHDDVDDRYRLLPTSVLQYLGYDGEKKQLYLKNQIDYKMLADMKERGAFPAGSEAFRDAMYRLVQQLREGYVREPHAVEVALEFKGRGYIDEHQALDGTSLKLTALRRSIGGGVHSLTVMLVNDTKVLGAFILQPSLRIETEKNGFVFCDGHLQSRRLAGEKDEELSLEMLYREHLRYATGLGTAAGWDVDGTGHGAVYTDFFPVAEIATADFSLPKELETEEQQILSMKYHSDLSEAPLPERIGYLKRFISSYAAWLQGVSGRIAGLLQKYQVPAHRNVLECRKLIDRMERGLALLESDGKVQAAFALANRAMFMQRVHMQHQRHSTDKEHYPGDMDVTEWLEGLDYRQEGDGDARWRPFQMAFLLMSIEGIIDEKAADRQLVDLIWFPTGGGKTEAYLGLSAFVIFYRRLAYPKAYGGVNIIMRYTLRLLTAQQFARASTLICACEAIRRDSVSRRAKYPKYSLGKEMISIGLWIGGSHTPNRNDNASGKNGARQLVDKLQEAKASSLRYALKQNRFQVLKCPWCGTALIKGTAGDRLVGKWGYQMRSGHFYMYCPNDDCLFREELPIQVVDEEIYRNPPTLLIGTVDKFAMLAWREEIGAFWGSAERRGPELIIQDELHLISGPLGSMVGLYEAAIDAICRDRGTNPKIIASTATICRSKAQCAALYDRDVYQFPPPGIDADDSYFSRMVQPNHDAGVFGRLYIGLMASGKRKATMEARTASAILQEAWDMDLPDDIRDMLWTLTVYFNSLRELGQGKSLMEDDVRDMLNRAAKRVGGKRRLIWSPEEMTSRVSTPDLNGIMERLERIRYSAKNIAAKKYPVDIVLSSNILSVGIDVARLNVMLMVGQPKLTSEYIQASSRIGRSLPGTIFVLYDGARSRDRSYFEQFKSYHEAFYKYVEPTGITPFSPPARERGLHAVLVSIIRNVIPGMAREMDAGNFDVSVFSEELQRIKAGLLKRVKEIRQRADVDVKDDTEEISAEIDRFIEHWDALAHSRGDDFAYGQKYMVKGPTEKGKRLLKPFDANSYDMDAYPTMTSMRNIDSAIKGNVIIWEENGHG